MRKGEPMRLIDADALREDCKRYLGTLNPDRDGKECTRIHWLIGVLENALTIDPEPCEDAVSRKSVRDKISEKDNWEKYDRYNLGLHDAMRVVRDEPSVTPKLAPCEDTVNRKTAIDALDEAKMIMMSVIDSLPENVKNEEAKIRIETISATVDSVKQILEKLPSVTPKRKTGKWIEYDSDDDKYDVIKCPCCKHTFTVDTYHWTDIGFVKDDFKFCPNCGADMRCEIDAVTGTVQAKEG